MKYYVEKWWDDNKQVPKKNFESPQNTLYVACNRNIVK